MDSLTKNIIFIVGATLPGDFAVAIMRPGSMNCITGLDHIEASYEQYKGAKFKGLRWEVLNPGEWNLSEQEGLKFVSVVPEMIPRHVVKPSDIKVSLEKIRSGIDGLNVDPSILKGVLYPLSGYDSTTPLTLFPNAETYVLLDRNSVIPIDLVERYSTEPLRLFSNDINQAYVVAKDTNENVLEALLTGFRAVVPGGRITQMDFIVDKKNNVSLRLKFTRQSSAGRLMEKEQTLYYLAGSLSEIGDLMDWVKYPWFVRLIQSVSPQVLIAKGSMGILSAIGSPSFQPARSFFLNFLYARGGVLIEGLNLDMNHRHTFEVSGHDQRLRNAISKFTVINDIQYGYVFKSEHKVTSRGRVQVSLINPESP